MKHNGLYIILATVIAFALLLTGCGSVGQTVEDVAQEEAVEEIEIVEAEIDEKDGEDVQPEMEEIGDKAEQVEASDADVREAAAEVQTNRQTENTVANVSSGTADASGGAQYPVIGGSESVDEDSGSHGVIGVIGVTGGGSQGGHVHDYSREVVAPICSQQGYTVFTCSCGDSYIGNYTPATGQHRWVLDYAEVPVYEKRGIHVCNVCGKDITDMTLGDHYFIDGCLGSWRSATIQVEVGTSYEVVGCHCGDCGKVAGE